MPYTALIAELLEYEGRMDESSLSRVWRKTQDHSCGIISGFRGENTRRENMSNNRQILVYLQGKGYSVTSVQGGYLENHKSKDEKEVKEPSFFVCNHKVEGDDGGELEDDLIKLGRKFDQDSVLIIPIGGKDAYLYGTSRRSTSWPGFGKKERVGSGRYGKVRGQFLTRVRGREFAFEDIAPPGTINGIRGQKIFAAKLEEEMRNG